MWWDVWISNLFFLFFSFSSSFFSSSFFSFLSSYFSSYFSSSSSPFSFFSSTSSLSSFSPSSRFSTSLPSPPSPHLPPYFYSPSSHHPPSYIPSPPSLFFPLIFPALLTVPPVTHSTLLFFSNSASSLSVSLLFLYSLPPLLPSPTSPTSYSPQTFTFFPCLLLLTFSLHLYSVLPPLSPLCFPSTFSIFSFQYFFSVTFYSSLLLHLYFPCILLLLLLF